MPLTIAPEPDYDSLVSIETADAYMSKMGHTWSGSEAAREVALRRGTQYLLGSYTIASTYLNPVHKKVQEACCEAALRSMNGSLFQDVQPGTTIKSEKVGPLETVYENTGTGELRYGVIDALLRGLGGSSSSGTLFLVRA